MGLGPQSTLLLHKLGQRLAYEMPIEELEALVAKAQEKRSIDRAVARLDKMIKADGSKVKRLPKAKVFTLEAAGLAPSVAALLRSQWEGKTDGEILQLLNGKGLLK